VLTAKDFETPLGTVKNDRKFTESLKRMCVQDFFVDELIHRSEHSIEFQVLFLQHLFGGKRDIRIVPILCTAFHLDDGKTDPTEMQAEVEGFLNALSQTVRESKRRVCIIAGVDLSHLGRRFGQEVDLSTDFIKMAQKEDNKMLEYVLDQDPPGFLQSILDEKDRRNVCGVPAIYSLLKLLDTGSGSTKLLKYDWAAEVPTQSLVTFAGVAFYDK
jgi:AmmeMemoRadiSam system protein B